jgi:DNA-binding transcriptional MerR regulator
MSMAIGEAARRAGCSVATIRYYEEIKLIIPAVRSANGRRSFGHADVSRLRFIRRAREFGMSIDQVRELLNAQQISGMGCEPAKSIIAARLDEVKRKASELAMLQASLEAMSSRCESECGTMSPACTIFEDMRAGEVVAH